jgi:hypothetical protein
MFELVALYYLSPNETDRRAGAFEKVCGTTNDWSQAREAARRMMTMPVRPLRVGIRPMRAAS